MREKHRQRRTPNPNPNPKPNYFVKSKSKQSRNHNPNPTRAQRYHMYVDSMPIQDEEFLDETRAEHIRDISINTRKLLDNEEVCICVGWCCCFFVFVVCVCAREGWREVVDDW